ncbi:MAG: TetR family transcriptional regulator [Microbacteriaceae bacterium]|nr:TetR family transcriptional regulator [Microbacteriaceae bacterium]
MGRPSVAEERRRQILEAAIRCLSRHGLSATTLDGIAAEAGMARGHVRHFAGNRDDILTGAALLLYYGDLPDPEQIATGAHTGTFLPPDTNSIEAALDYLFGELAAPGPENAAALALVDAGRTNQRIHAVVSGAYLSSEVELAALIGGAAPRASTDDVASVAYGVVALALGNVFMSDIEVSDEHTRRARNNAERLVNGLIDQ